MKKQVITIDYLKKLTEKLSCSQKETIFAIAIANYWLERRLPYNNHDPSNKVQTNTVDNVDERLKKFHTAFVEKLITEKPTMITGNIFFKDVPCAPKFPWITWTSINWEKFVFITKEETINPFDEK